MNVPKSNPHMEISHASSSNNNRESLESKEEAQKEIQKKSEGNKSPMIGTFYRSPNPDSPSFVEPGDKIKAGQPVCIIEAMKLFNEIEAEISGTIVEILVDNATPVEFDQPLFLVETA
jgi:acetyl-CoA carboxylase biotin carboxyl carrier protein